MQWRIGRLRGKFCLVIWRDGRRQRYSLGTNDKAQAEKLAPAIYHEVTRPKGTTCDELWRAYCDDRAGRAVVATMRHTWRVLSSRFAARDAASVSVTDCREHIRQRREVGISDGTIHTELGHLRTVLKWAEKRGLIERAPHIERPAKPRPKEHYLSRQAAIRLRLGATVPHVQLFIILAQATGARSAALLDLTWDRVDFDAGQIDLRNPQINRPHKGRPVVPMNREARTALQEAKQGAISAHVIEWAGKPVKSVKRGLKEAARKAGLANVTPHILRHSAAVHMAEAGISMDEIAQFLGHSDVAVTRRVYARFSSDHLRKAAAVLEYDDLSGRIEPKITTQGGGHGE